MAVTVDDGQRWLNRPQQLAIWLNQHIPAGARVLEIGPGHTPFFRSTHFIDNDWGDYAIHGMVEGAVYVRCDVERERIPFPDKYFDFVFTSHVLEDLSHPQHCLKEMERVGKAGFITTPSPIVEIMRGIQSQWRGYLHHNWFVWVQDGVLTLANKRVPVEYLPVGDEDLYERMLRKNGDLAHTYYAWEGSIDFHIHPFDDLREYAGNVIVGILEGTIGTRQFLDGVLKDLAEKPTGP